MTASLLPGKRGVCVSIRNNLNDWCTLKRRVNSGLYGIDSFLRSKLEERLWPFNSDITVANSYPTAAGQV